MTFYNTTNEVGEDLEELMAKEVTQTGRILIFFKLNRGIEYTPFEVYSALGFAGVPVTSIRRAMTDLTNKGELVKTETKKEEIYGHKNYCWKLNVEEDNEIIIL